MAITFLNTDAQLITAAESLVSSSTMASVSFTRVTITNIDNASHNVTLYRVPSGGTPGTTNIIVDPSAYPGLIAAGETVALPLTGHNLTGGQSIYGKADAGSVVNISFSYVQQS